jgi:hypothetical protein
MSAAKDRFIKPSSQSIEIVKEGIMANIADITQDGQMSWKPEGVVEPALHLRHDASEPWRPYEDFPQYFLPDPEDFSKGYATFLALLKKGWKTL